MKIIESSFNTVLQDLTEALNSGEDTIFGYLIADRITIWDPIWINPSKETLPPIRFDYAVANALDIDVIKMPLAGGTIVNSRGDIGIFVASKDKYSHWEDAAMQNLVEYLKQKYKIEAEISGNDILIDGKKFVGTSIGFSTHYRYAAMFIAMNDYGTPLINMICTKPTKHKGFVGLSRYRVCPRKLITRILKFTKKWEARGL